MATFLLRKEATFFPHCRSRLFLDCEVERRRRKGWFNYSLLDFFLREIASLHFIYSLDGLACGTGATGGGPLFSASSYGKNFNTHVPYIV